MAADSSANFNLLHRTCTLVVLLCFLHISVTVVFYIRSLDIRFAFVQNQQSYNNGTQSTQVRHSVLTSHVQSQEPGKVEKEEELPKELGKCPETSPQLGKSSRSKGSSSVCLIVTWCETVNTSGGPSGPGSNCPWNSLTSSRNGDK